MKTKLKAFFIFVTALVVLSSCLIGINDDPSEPTTEKFVYSSTFKGPVYTGLEITSYQFMCYVNNKTGMTLEDVEFEIKWIDSTGKTITKDTVTIPRLERGSRWPVGVMHDKESDPNFLEEFKDFKEVSIRYVSSSSDLSRYATITQTGQVSHEVTPSYAHCIVRNYNAYDILDPQVYVVTETSSGEYIAEYGMVKYRDILAANGGYLDFNTPLNPKAMTPYGTDCSVFVVGLRRDIL